MSELKKKSLIIALVESFLVVCGEELPLNMCHIGEYNRTNNADKSCHGFYNNNNDYGK